MPGNLDMPNYENTSTQTSESNSEDRRRSSQSRNRIHIAPHTGQAIDYYPSGKVPLPDMKKAYARFRAANPDIDKPKLVAKSPKKIENEAIRRFNERNRKARKKSSSPGFWEKIRLFLLSLFGKKKKGGKKYGKKRWNSKGKNKKRYRRRSGNRKKKLNDKINDHPRRGGSNRQKSPGKSKKNRPGNWSKQNKKHNQKHENRKKYRPRKKRYKNNPNNPSPKSS